MGMKRKVFDTGSAYIIPMNGSMLTGVISDDYIPNEQYRDFLAKRKFHIKMIKNIVLSKMNDIGASVRLKWTNEDGIDMCLELSASGRKVEMNFLYYKNAFAYACVSGQAGVYYCLVDTKGTQDFAQFLSDVLSGSCPYSEESPDKYPIFSLY